MGIDVWYRAVRCCTRGSSSSDGPILDECLYRTWLRVNDTTVSATTDVRFWWCGRHNCYPVSKPLWLTCVCPHRSRTVEDWAANRFIGCAERLFNPTSGAVGQRFEYIVADRRLVLMAFACTRKVSMWSKLLQAPWSHLSTSQPHPEWAEPTALELAKA